MSRTLSWLRDDSAKLLSKVGYGTDLMMYAEKFALERFQAQRQKSNVLFLCGHNVGLVLFVQTI